MRDCFVALLLAMTKIVYSITYNIYRILCYTYGLLKLNPAMLIIIYLSLRREREGEGDEYYLKVN